MKRLISLIVSLLLLASCTPASAQFYGDDSYTSNAIVTPAGAYLGASCPTANPCDTLASAIGRPLAMRMFYFNMTDLTGIGTNSEITDTYANGSVPFISWGCNNIYYTTLSSGADDTALNNSMQALKNIGGKAFVRIGWEINDNLNGGTNNNENCFNEAGSPSIAQQAAQYVAYFHHIRDLAAQNGVHNITWVWCPDAGDGGGISKSEMRDLYPGDALVDWLCFDAYDRQNIGPVSTMKPMVSFLTATFPNKPIVVGETGDVNPAGPCNNNVCTSWEAQDAWLEALLAAIKPGGQLAGVKGFSYWNSCASTCGSTYWNWVLQGPGITGMTTIGADPFMSYMPQ